MWAKYCEVLDNLFVQSMCIPSGSPMTAAPDIMTSSTSSLQGSRKSSGLRSESHDVKASCICTEFTSCYSSSMLLCTHNGFWKHHILFLPKMHKSLYAMWGRMHRTWQNLWERGWRFSIWVKAPFFTGISWDKASKSRFCGTSQFKLGLSPLKWPLSASFTFESKLVLKVWFHDSPF